MEISLMFFGWAWVEIGCPLPLETPPCNFLSALQMCHQPCSNFPISGVECTSGINVWGHQWRCQSLQLPSMAINTNLQPSIPTNNDTRMFSIKFGLCFVFSVFFALNKLLLVHVQTRDCQWAFVFDLQLGSHFNQTVLCFYSQRLFLMQLRCH